MSTNNTGDFYTTNTKGERVAAKAYYLDGHRIGVFADYHEAIKALLNKQSEDKWAYSCFSNAELSNTANLIGCKTKELEESMHRLHESSSSFEFSEEPSHNDSVGVNANEDEEDEEYWDDGLPDMSEEEIRDWYGYNSYAGYGERETGNWCDSSVGYGNVEADEWENDFYENEYEGTGGLLDSTGMSHKDYVRMGYEHHELMPEEGIKSSPNGVCVCITYTLSEMGSVREYFNSNGDPLTEAETREIEHRNELDVMDMFDDEEEYYELKRQPCDLGIEISGNTRTIRERPLAEFVASDKDGSTDIYKISGTSNFEILYSSKNINVVLVGDDVNPKGERMPRDVSDRIAREYAKRNGYYRQGLDAYINEKEGRIIVTLKRRSPADVEAKIHRDAPCEFFVAGKGGSKTEARFYYFNNIPIGLFADYHDAVKEIITSAVKDKESEFGKIFFNDGDFQAVTLVGCKTQWHKENAKSIPRGEDPMLLDWDACEKNGYEHYDISKIDYVDTGLNVWTSDSGECFDASGDVIPREKVIALCNYLEDENDNFHPETAEEDMEKEIKYDIIQFLRSVIGEAERD